MSVEFITIEDAKGIYKEQAIITNEDGSVTAMPKSIYDQQQAEQSTPIVIDEAETI
jgi:hypothetical protein